MISWMCGVRRWACRVFLLLGFWSAAGAQTFSVQGAEILHNGQARMFRGVNAMHVFGGSPTEMAAWNVDMVRVFVGAMRDTPLTGPPVRVGNWWLRSIQALIDANRAAGKVTVLCPFGWDGSSATVFSGKNPREQAYFNAYKVRMQSWAQLVRNQPDVWIEVWNEPYRWDNSNGYSDAMWLSDMAELVDNIRSTGAQNIVVVPGNRQGQGEEVLLTHGQALLNGRHSLVFDLHAYERWLQGSGLPNTDLASVQARIAAVQDKGLALMFGEVGPMNAGTLMDPRVFLTAVQRQKVSTLAWLWKFDGNDKDALLDRSGVPNDNGNHQWGSTFLAFTSLTLPP